MNVIAFLLLISAHCVLLYWVELLYFTVCIRLFQSGLPRAVRVGALAISWLVFGLVVIPIGVLAPAWLGAKSVVQIGDSDRQTTTALFILGCVIL
ncbi:MAG: hypothetical protein AAFN78_07705, partial [Pseudomonadota bacterium]